MKRALVTGGAGFVGRYVVEKLLRDGFRVRSYSRSPAPSLSALGVEVVQGDLADEGAVSKACEGMDAVFHVAAKAGIWGDWNSFYRPNVLGTRNVIEGCREKGIGQLIYTSTPSVVFNRRPFRGGDESLPYGSRWLGHYAHTKAIAEEEVLRAANDSLSVVALRPHLVFGPGDPHLLPRIVESVAAGRLKIVGKGSNKVDVSYVDDVADAHILAMKALTDGKVSGEAYFISQGEPVELWPWTNTILARLGYEPLAKKVPLGLAFGAGFAAEAVWKLARRTGEPPITRFAAVELAKDHYFSIEKAKRDLGYQPKTPIDEAVDATVDDLMARGYGNVR